MNSMRLTSAFYMGHFYMPFQRQTHPLLHAFHAKNTAALDQMIEKSRGDLGVLIRQFSKETNLSIQSDDLWRLALHTNFTHGIEMLAEAGLHLAFEAAKGPTALRLDEEFIEEYQKRQEQALEDEAEGIPSRLEPLNDFLPSTVRSHVLAEALESKMDISVAVAESMLQSFNEQEEPQLAAKIMTAALKHPNVNYLKRILDQNWDFKNIPLQWVPRSFQYSDEESEEDNPLEPPLVRAMKHDSSNHLQLFLETLRAHQMMLPEESKTQALEIALKGGYQETALHLIKQHKVTFSQISVDLLGIHEDVLKEVMIGLKYDLDRDLLEKMAFHAATRVNVNLLRECLDLGFTLDVKNESGMRVMDVLAKDPSSWNLLIECAQKLTLEELEAPFMGTAQNQGNEMTLLLTAAVYHDLETLQELVKLGSNPLAKDRFGRNLAHCILINHVEEEDALIEKLAWAFDLGVDLMEPAISKTSKQALSVTGQGWPVGPVEIAMSPWEDAKADGKQKVADWILGIVEAKRCQADLEATIPAIQEPKGSSNSLRRSL